MLGQSYIFEPPWVEHITVPHSMGSILFDISSLFDRGVSDKGVEKV